MSPAQSDILQYIATFFAFQVVRIQYYTAKMTEPLVTRNIQYNFTFLLSFFASFKDMICSFISLTVTPLISAYI